MGDAATGAARPLVLVDDAHVTYRIFRDGRRPGLRSVVANRFRATGSQLVHAVRGISLTIRQGELVGLIGPNGSGKSTLLRAVAGLIPTQHGRVYVSSPPALLGVDAAMHPDLSGRNNIYLGGTAMGLSRRQVAEIEDDIIAFSGLTDSIDMPLRAYSSGMQARLHFSIASAVEPEILLIDEAFAVGDRDFRRKSDRRLRELQSRAGAVCLVSHNMDVILEMCTRVVWLEDGVVAMDGLPGEVVEAYSEAPARG